METLDSEQVQARGSGAEMPHGPDGASREALDHACTLVALLVDAAADLRKNGQHLRDGLVAARHSVRRLRDLPSPQPLDARARAARLARMRSLLETLGAADGNGATTKPDAVDLRSRAIALSTLSHDITALEQELHHRQHASAAHEDAAYEISEAALMMDGLIETLYALVQSAVLHENAATELKELLEGSRLMAALDARF